MVIVSEIFPDSIAAELDIEEGDRIIAANGQTVSDFLDVLIAEKNHDVELIVEKGNGDVWQLEIEKEVEDLFGFVVEHPEPKHCGNNCIFCFVHQLPKGMRRTLYVKDEDYRFSYLYGAYITLTNLSEQDIERIIEQRLSPLYISVHAVDEELRAKMLGCNVPPVMPILQKLTDSGIELHTQVVVCPGVNDGEHLHASVNQLADLHPGVQSLALVPVGLTEHRQSLSPLTPVSREDAVSVLDNLSKWQDEFIAAMGTRFVFAADEFYLKAGVDVPDLSEYEALAQIENGVGMISLFRDEVSEALEEAADLECAVEFSIVTGRSFHDELQVFMDELAAILNCTPNVYAIENRLFGPAVTVAGLIAGKDIVSQLHGEKLGSAILVPDVMIRDGENHFLDDLTPEALARELGCNVVVIPSTPMGLLEAIEDLSDGLSP